MTDYPSNLKTVDGRLNQEQVDNFLKRYKDPSEARRLLIQMNMIDEGGKLTPTYSSDD
jgi:hypothetical protein